MLPDGNRCLGVSMADYGMPLTRCKAEQCECWWPAVVRLQPFKLNLLKDSKAARSSSASLQVFCLKQVQHMESKEELDLDQSC